MENVKAVTDRNRDEHVQYCMTLCSASEHRFK